MMKAVLVARAAAGGLEYLVNRPDGLSWDAGEQSAVRYPNVREATRAAMRLPSRLRAFALPVPYAA
jgi:hypothetical protein